MKKILGIIGSPRRLGNCEIMVKEISRHILVPHELQLLRLQDFNILPCRACYICLKKEGRCKQDDDFYTILNSIIEADALILSAPAYFLGANSCLKKFMDRGLAFYAHIEKLWGKPSVGTGIAGIEGNEGSTLLNIESFLKFIYSEGKKCVMVYGSLPGEIFFNEENKKMAANLAAALFEPMPENTESCCPICGGTTFRFTENRRIHCMLCSNSGEIILQSGNPVFRIKNDKLKLFASKRDALRHRDLIAGMMDTFIKQKNKLKDIIGTYKEEGNWIKP